MARFRVDPTSVTATRKAVQTSLNRFIRGSGVLNDVANDYIEQVKIQGKDTQTDQPFKPLAQSTIARRRVLSRNNATDGKYSPARSNLTFTGQLVNSIKATIQVARGRITIEPKGVHKAYRGIRVRRLGRNIQNKALAAHLEDQGRTLIGSSPKTQERIVSRIRASLRIFLRALNR